MNTKIELFYNKKPYLNHKYLYKELRDNKLAHEGT